MNPKICFQMVVFQSDFVLKQALQAVMPFGEVIVTEGPVKYFADRGWTTSTDRTNEILADLLPAKNVIHGQWAEKDHMAQAAEHLIPQDTTHVWIVDADEVWDQRDLAEVIANLADVDSVEFKPRTFFGGFDYILTGFETRSQWIRVQRWEPGAHWRSHRPPKAVAPNGVLYRDMNHVLAPQTFCHYSYVLPSQVKMKVEYYASWGAGVIPHWFETVYLPFVRGDDADRRVIQKKWNGVHEWVPQRRGDCWAVPYTSHHPPHIRLAMAELLERFNAEVAEYR